jgi:hypothetical protein
VADRTRRHAVRLSMRLVSRPSCLQCAFLYRGPYWSEQHCQARRGYNVAWNSASVRTTHVQTPDPYSVHKRPLVPPKRPNGSAITDAVAGVRQRCKTLVRGQVPRAHCRFLRAFCPVWRVGAWRDTALCGPPTVKYCMPSWLWDLLVLRK